MFQALKRIFRREEGQPAAPAPPLASPTPSPRSHVAPTPLAPLSPEEAAPAPANHFAAAQDPTPAAQNTTGDQLVRLPLKNLLPNLPAALKSRVRQTGIANIQLPLALEDLTPQLARGRVQIPWGTLRALVPPGVISDSPDQDKTPVDLPLADILSRVPPQLLHRRRAQKTIEIPDEVAPVFNKRGGSQDIRVLADEKPRAVPQTGKVAPPRRTPSAPPQPARAPEEPAAPIAMNQGDLDLLAKARASAKQAPAPRPIAAPIAPVPSPKQASTPLPGTTRPPATAPTPPPPTTPKELPKAKPAPAPAPAPAAQPHTPVTPPATLGAVSIPLADVINSFPDAIKPSLEQAKTQNAVFALPSADLEKGLKGGKVAFPWRTLRSCLQPAVITSTTPAADNLVIELPLAVVAPIFLASHRTSVPRKMAVINQDIPDVFTPVRSAAAPVPAPTPVASPPQPEPVTTPTPVAPPPPPEPVTTPAPVASTPPPDTVAPPPAIAIPVPATPPPQPVSPPAADIGELFGQPGRKNWTPAEIVHKTSELDGVGGALVVLPDGLLVAAHLPPGLDGDTIAAFLPQMFTRMTQYCKELKFGDPRKMTFVIDEVPMKIYRGSGVYFTVLGRSGELLPDEVLDVIAAQLGCLRK